MTLRTEMPILLVAVTLLVGAGCEKAANAPANKPSTPANTVAAKPAEPEAKPSSPAAAGKEIKPADGPKLKSVIPPDDAILGGVLNDLATSLPAPDREGAKETGKVTVEVLVNEKGEVSTSSVVSGPQPLWKAAGAAARQAKFAPPLKDGKPVKVAGVLIYDFAK